MHHRVFYFCRFNTNHVSASSLQAVTPRATVKLFSTQQVTPTRREGRTGKAPEHDVSAVPGNRSCLQLFRETREVMITPQDKSEEKRLLPSIHTRHTVLPSDAEPIGPLHANKRCRRRNHISATVSKAVSENTIDSDFTADPGRAHPIENYFTTSGWPWYWDERELGVSLSSRNSPLRPASFLPSVASNTSLYNTMIYLAHIRNSPLSALIDYHDLYTHFKSTRSYNLLITTALDRNALGVAERLFGAMEKDDIKNNLETFKLRTRWLIKTGRWDEAWSEMAEIGASVIQPSGCGGTTKHNSLLPIWLEFCRMVDHNPILQSRRLRNSNISNTRSSRGASLKKDVTNEAMFTRLSEIISHSPVDMPSRLSFWPPRAIFGITSALLKCRQHPRAVTLTRLYFETIPRTGLSAKFMRECMDIIHLYLAYGSSKKGLAGFYELRRNMVSLLKLHPSLRPTSTTLRLLLTSLKRTKRCGTIAMKLLDTFKSQWGLHIIDRRVIRRVISLALKEGRMDIVDKLMQHEQSVSWSRKSWKFEKDTLGGMDRIPYRKLLRLPRRKMYRRNGRERRLWLLLSRRINKSRVKRRV